MRRGFDANRRRVGGGGGPLRALSPAPMVVADHLATDPDAMPGSRHYAIA